MIVKVFNPVAQLADVHRRQLGDVLVVQPEVQRLAVEARPTALGAHGTREKLACPLLCRAGGGLVLLHLDILHQTVKGKEVIAGGQRLGAQVQALVGTVEDVVQGLLGQLLERCVKGAAIFFTDSLDLPENLHILVFSQGQDAATPDGLLHVGHDLVTVNEVDIAQALAMGTGTQG